MSDLIQTERSRPGVLPVRLNRPDVPNAMNTDLIEALNDVFVRMGWGEACAEIQKLYLSGRAELAAQAVPTEMVDDVALIGPVDKICEDIVNRWKPTCLTTLILGGWPRPESRQRILEAVRS